MPEHESQLQALLGERAQLMDEVLKLNPEAHVTFHYPTGKGEWGFQVHEWGKPLSGFHKDMVSACEEAISRMKNTKKENIYNPNDI